MYPARSGFVRFKSAAGMNYDHLRKLEDEVKKQLLTDKRFISAYDLPENQAKRITFHKSQSDWPLYGVKGSEFDGSAISTDYVYRSLWISISIRSDERYSKKVRDIKTLIASAIGKEDIQNFTTSVELVSVFPNLKP